MKKAKVQYRAGTKKIQVRDMIQRKSGATVTEVSKRLKVSRAAASSLVHDVRRMGYRLMRHRNGNGESVYTVAA